MGKVIVDRVGGARGEYDVVLVEGLDVKPLKAVEAEGVVILSDSPLDGAVLEGCLNVVLIVVKLGWNLG